ncbi:uncharacterized protein LOC117481832 [Trematomus bernacchii]|uniref:uncharacterized protein LOC117481832 n=1 Tax=Trematomus bernacchii TaxID=40690 RepID=UPI00146D6F98|nr:uncharacterized protein LOC117481832 [Trematomus bernacchii]
MCVQMAGLCWISVLLAVSLSIGDCEPLDIGYVKRIDARIHEIYKYGGKQYSVAVNIPEDPQTTKELKGLILPVDWVDANTFLEAGQVYKGNNAVVAIPQGEEPYTEHAEKQVLDNLGELANIREGYILVLYSWLSPCGQCTEEGGNFNILNKIEELKNRGKSFALVFNTVYAWKEDNNGKKKDIPEADIKNTFHSLRQVIVDDNIFRCYKPNNRVFQCFKCFVDASPEADPVDECVKIQE